jgi:hypothetical protein
MIEILNNLKFAQNRTIDEVKVIPKVGFESCFVISPEFTITIPVDCGCILIVFISFFGLLFSESTVVKRISFL